MKHEFYQLYTYDLSYIREKKFLVQILLDNEILKNEMEIRACIFVNFYRPFVSRQASMVKEKERVTRTKDLDSGSGKTFKISTSYFRSFRFAVG